MGSRTILHHEKTSLAHTSIEIILWKVSHIVFHNLCMHRVVDPISHCQEHATYTGAAVVTFRAFRVAPSLIGSKAVALSHYLYTRSPDISLTSSPAHFLHTDCYSPFSSHLQDLVTRSQQSLDVSRNGGGNGAHEDAPPLSLAVGRLLPTHYANSE